MFIVAVGSVPLVPSILPHMVLPILKHVMFPVVIFIQLNQLSIAESIVSTAEKSILNSSCVVNSTGRGTFGIFDRKISFPIRKSDFSVKKSKCPPPPVEVTIQL